MVKFCNLSFILKKLTEMSQQFSNTPRTFVVVKFIDFITTNIIVFIDKMPMNALYRI